MRALKLHRKNKDPDGVHRSYQRGEHANVLARRMGGRRVVVVLALGIGIRGDQRGLQVISKTRQQGMQVFYAPS